MKHSAAWLVIPALILALCIAIMPLGAFAIAAEEEDKSSDEKYITFTKDHPLGETRPDSALIYVLRPTSLGFAIKSFFLMDDEILGINRGSSYFFVNVKPGKHVFWSKSENVDALELNVEAGKTYYIQQHVQIGGFRARTKLEVLDEADAKEALAKCDKHGTLTAAGREKGMEIAREHRKDTQKDLDRRAKEAASEKK